MAAITVSFSEKQGTRNIKSFVYSIFTDSFSARASVCNSECLTSCAFIFNWQVEPVGFGHCAAVSDGHHAWGDRDQRRSAHQPHNHQDYESAEDRTRYVTHTHTYTQTSHMYWTLTSQIMLKYHHLTCGQPLHISLIAAKHKNVLICLHACVCAHLSNYRPTFPQFECFSFSL